MTVRYSRAVVARRFWARVQKSESCWNWTGVRNEKGYGRLRHNGVYTFAHRVAFALEHGRVLPGAVVMHICDNPSCVRVDHLRLGTQAENNLDMVLKGRHEKQRRTHCPKGHEYDATNTGWRGGLHGRQNRYCLTCSRERMRVQRKAR